MVAQGYATQITLVTKEIIAQGRTDAGATIAGQMLKEGNTEFVTIYKAATKKEGAEEVKESEQDSKPITQKLKEGLSSVTNNAEGIAIICTAHMLTVRSLFPDCIRTVAAYCMSCLYLLCMLKSEDVLTQLVHT